MKTPIVAAGFALLALTSFPAAAQSPGPPAAAVGQTAARYAVDKTPIRIIWADPRGHDVLLKELPDIGMYMDMIKDMTLIQVAPQSGGIINDEKLKAIQADLDALK